jgi:serine/threonine protein kinase
MTDPVKGPLEHSKIEVTLVPEQASAPPTGGPGDERLDIDQTKVRTQSPGAFDGTSSSTAPLRVSDGFSHLDIGSMLGPYRLESKLGEGGMGAVYKAVHTKLGKVVAVKVLTAQLVQRPDSIARFEREMLAVGKLSHSHIVQAYDAGEISGAHYLAMEYVEGSDLAKLIQDHGPFSVVNACKAIRQAAQALAAAHAAGLVHRDIKPSNILVAAKGGQVKLLDLGLALLAEDGGKISELTTAGQTFGTPDYMAPEQWDDAHAADARTDLYALGCTLYFLLVGRAPYGTEQYRTLTTKMKGHVIDPIPDLKLLAPQVPEAVVAIYRKLLAKAPEDRFQTAAEVAQALAPFTSSKSNSLDNTLVTTEAPTAETALTTAETSSPVVIVDDRRGRPPTTSRTWQLAGFGAFSAVLLCAIIITITKRDGAVTKIEVPDDSKVEITTKDNGHAETGWHGWPTNAPKPAIAPFDAAQARNHQEEWAAYLKLPVEYTNSIGMKFVLIPPGEFPIGSTPAEIEAVLKDFVEDKDRPEYTKSEAPQHKVILTQVIYLGVNEVTQKEYERVMKATPSCFSNTGPGKDAVAGMETATAV